MRKLQNLSQSSGLQQLFYQMAYNLGRGKRDWFQLEEYIMVKQHSENRQNHMNHPAQTIDDNWIDQNQN
jgi:hypothetical protein